MKFHKKECQKKFEGTHSKCTHCGQKIFTPELTRHEEVCKTVPAHHKVKGKGQINTLATMESGKNGIADSQGLYACKGCGRKFGAYRISTHENICLRLKAKPKGKGDALAKPKQMTLADLGKPQRSKQASSGKYAKKAGQSKTGKEPVAFQGKGVKVSTAFEADGNLIETKPAKPVSFSGLKVEKYEPKIVYKWRCTY
mmetsp:Transcript_11470/g.13029  ORF Transcript_11470/g.13029 Transcript_11470/m.13029 type:complete len:198 (-) Transcript_11470:504-1097(-)